MHVVVVPDPSLELLPESYFRDDKLDDDEVLESGASASEDGGTADAADVSAHTTVSPRAVSNSRKKRKRKTSQSERKQSKSPPPTSSLEGPKPSGLRTNPSPPNPASPDSIISPCSPVSALASDCTPRSPECLPESRTHCNTSGFSTSSLSPSSPWINIEKKRKNSNQSTPRSKTNSTGEDEIVLRSDSAPASNHPGQNWGQPGRPITPQSAPGKVPGHTKPRGEKRTRLLNKFNSMTIELEPAEQSQTASEVYSRQSSCPTQTEGIAKGPWACISTGYVTMEAVITLHCTSLHIRGLSRADLPVLL